jgi:hypothetical protein
MLVRDYAYVDAPAAMVQQRLVQGAGSWLGSAAAHAADVGNDVRVRLGPRGLDGTVSKEIVVHTGDPVCRPSATVIPLTWRASGSSALFPIFHGDLEVAPLGEQRTQLSLWGHYDPPLGALGIAVDKVVMHRVAEASVRAFLRDVAAVLTEQLDGHTAPV